MTQTARAAVLEAVDQPIAIREYEVPKPEPGALVVKVHYGGICGTDLHLQHGHLKIDLPVVLGHEAVGEIFELGEGVDIDLWGNNVAVGDLVAWPTSVPCNQCYWCVVEGERSLCSNRKVYGINQPTTQFPRLAGGWGEYIYLFPGTGFVKVPDGVSALEVISLGCAGPTAVHGVVDVTGIDMGDTVLVQGSGPVGVASAMYARLNGAGQIIMVGGPEDRLALVREMGIADETIDIFTETDGEARIRKVVEMTTANRGVDVGLECTGVATAVPEGMEMVRRNGKYLIMGHYSDVGTVPVNPHVITRKQLKVYGSWASHERHFAGYVRSLVDLGSRFDLKRLVTAFPLSDVNAAMAAVAEGNVMKAVLKMGD